MLSDFFFLLVCIVLGLAVSSSSSCIIYLQYIVRLSCKKLKIKDYGSARLKSFLGFFFFFNGA